MWKTFEAVHVIRVPESMFGVAVFMMRAGVLMMRTAILVMRAAVIIIEADHLEELRAHAHDREAPLDARRGPFPIESIAPAIVAALPTTGAGRRTTSLALNCYPKSPTSSRQARIRFLCCRALRITRRGTIASVTVARNACRKRSFCLIQRFSRPPLSIAP